MKSSGQLCSLNPFQLDIDAYDVSLDSLYAKLGATVSEKAFASHTVVKLKRSGSTSPFYTFATRGLGCLPLFDTEINGWVSRELAFTVCKGCTDDQAFTFVTAIANGMLDVQSSPPDGSCLEWPEVLRVVSEHNSFQEIYMGTLFLADEHRRFSVAGAPETLVLEIVPLTESEVNALAACEDTVAAYFRRSGRHAADLSRR